LESFLVAAARLAEARRKVNNYFHLLFRVKTNYLALASGMWLIDCAMSKVKLTLRVRELALAKGIENAKQLSEASGLGLNAAYGLWNDTSTRFDRSSLESVCATLDCTHVDLFTTIQREKRR
jgi:DNA-binding Xre family transcriptional regulator